MARSNTWLNNDGLEIGFGWRTAVNGEAGTVRTVGNTNQIEVDLIAGYLEGTGAAQGNIIPIPAGSYIKSAEIRVDEAFSTDLVIGIKEQDGSVIAADAIYAGAGDGEDGTDSAGVVVGNGSLVGGTATIGDADGYIYISTGAAATAGKGKLFVEFSKA